MVGTGYIDKHPLVRASYFLDHKEYPDLSQYRRDVSVVAVSPNHPNTVIVIIGESMMRSHCGVYGYDKNTTPVLSDMDRSGNLVTFDSVTSMATKTVRSLKTILSSYREDGTNWWDHTTIVDVAKACGYRTEWISAQERNGVYGVLATQYAMLCDTATFLSDQNMPPYDGSLLEIGVGDYRKVLFYHLAGSHPSFDQRYPETFSGFDQSEYTDKPDWQRYNYATYDTSLLYTDSVVTEIFNRHAGEDAVGILLSDHGLDFYATDPHYCGHAKNDESSLRFARDIPFMMWMSDSFRAAHPDVYLSLRDNRHKSWCVSELVFLLPHIMGFEITDEEDIYPLL